MTNTLKVILLLVLFTITSNLSFAQKEFSINDGSTTYAVLITVAKCESNECSGQGTVVLYDKASNTIFQTLKSEDLYFFHEGLLSPTVNVIEIYGEQSPLIFDDFNFDGNEDLAVRNGNNGSYGGPSYDIYLLNTATRQFEINSKFTELASINLGMFETDREKQRLITFNKSGCCWHITTEYEVSDNNLVKVYEVEEDATGDSGYVTVIEHKLTKGVWYVSTKKSKIEDYYK